MRRKYILLMTFILTIITILIYFQHRSTLTEQQNQNIHTTQQTKKVSSKERENIESMEPIYYLMGKERRHVVERFGLPSRIDHTEYGYDWWVYNESPSSYYQIGMENNKVVSIYVMGSDVNISPFQLNQPVHELKQIMNFSNQFEFEVDQNIYQIQLSEEEMQTNPLVQWDGMWAQLNIDQFNNTIFGIRFIDDRTFVKMRPYDLLYRGNLISAEEVSPEKWEEIGRGKALQITDMTNIIRHRNGLSPVSWDEDIATVAYKHSYEMYEQAYFSHHSPVKGSLADRLINDGVFFKEAGENIAAHYVDAISVMEGWLNSESHRKTMLLPEFTHLGVGVYKKYYTQNFIQK